MQSQNHDTSEREFLDHLCLEYLKQILSELLRAIVREHRCIQSHILRRQMHEELWLAGSSGLLLHLDRPEPVNCQLYQ